ncbi:MAG: amidohydrolase [Clostridiales Family XIII bacterium]|nr:amidohydrolase [Clostridiales Family XIII bacterium]
MNVNHTESAADILIRGNVIFDSLSDVPFRGAVAVKGNRIAAVLKDDDGAMMADAHTKIVDAGGRLVMPGFHDNHVHLLMAGMFREYVNLIDCRSAEESAKLAYEAAQKDEDKSGWVIGFQWYHVFWDNPELPDKKTLDAYFPDRPVFLLNAEAHGCWLNSAGLKRAGITKDTPDPDGGVIVRDETGEPTGILLEGAVALVTIHALVFPPEKERSLIRSYMDGAKAYGITSLIDVMPYFHGNMGDLSIYSEMDRSGELTTRIHAAPDLFGDLDLVLDWQKKYNSEKLTVNHVKQFVDGVFTTHTALMLDDYADKSGDRGLSLFDTDAIEAAVPEAHKRGLSVKLHCLGDRANRMALDYYEKAIRLYGKNNCRHAIEHCELVTEEDIPRFGQLGIVPSVQPEQIALTQIYAENPYPAVLGKDRAWQTWRLRDLLASAGVMAFGSDCPVIDNNPFFEIYRAVTRVHNDGEPAGGQNPAQKLTVAESLKAYTAGSAYSALRDHELGSLRAGNFADIIILDRNLFETDDIKNARVDLTVFDGEIIYERDKG